MCARQHPNMLKAAMLGMSEPAQAPTESTKSEQPLEHAPASKRPPSRQNKRVVSAYVRPEAARQLRLLAAELDQTAQELIEEALNDLFRKHNKSAIA